MPAVKGVGEPCAGEPHARIDVAAGGNRKPVGPARAARNLAPPADPPVWSTVALTLANRAKAAASFSLLLTHQLAREVWAQCVCHVGFRSSPTGWLFTSCLALVQTAAGEVRSSELDTQAGLDVLTVTVQGSIRMPGGLTPNERPTADSARSHGSHSAASAIWCNMLCRAWPSPQNACWAASPWIL